MPSSHQSQEVFKLQGIARTLQISITPFTHMETMGPQIGGTKATSVLLLVEGTQKTMWCNKWK